MDILEDLAIAADICRACAMDDDDAAHVARLDRLVGYLRTAKAPDKRELVMQVADEQVVGPMGADERARSRHRERKAIDRYREDAQFNRLIQMTVANVMRTFGEVDPQRADRDACDIATRTAALILQSLYEEHGELNRLRAEADNWKRLAEENVELRPKPPIMFPSPPLPSS
jgi:hypothetical protein